MSSRIEQLEQSMNEKGWDSLLVTDPKHVYYLTGFASDPHERFLGLLLVRGEEPTLIVLGPGRGSGKRRIQRQKHRDPQRHGQSV